MTEINNQYLDYLKNLYGEDNYKTHLEDKTAYLSFLSQVNNLDENKINKAKALLDKVDVSKVILNTDLEAFEYILFLIKNQLINEADIEYIINTRGFYDGFRDFLLAVFSNNKKSSNTKNRKWAELDPIISRLISQYFTAQNTK